MIWQYIIVALALGWAVYTLATKVLPIRGKKKQACTSCKACSSIQVPE